MLEYDTSALRQRAIAAFQAGVVAADPENALQTAFQSNPLQKIKRGGQHVIVAVGKAACKMASYTINHLPQGADFTAIAVTNFDNVEAVKGCEVLAASHPVPCEKGLQAGRKVISLLTSATEQDIVIMLISGGASALLPVPVSGIGLYHKVQVNNLLLSSGLDIYETNLVRQSLSALKGGGGLKLAYPAEVHSYIMSDVLGDDLRVVGSGPSTGSVGTTTDARRCLIEKGIYTKLPNLVRQHFENAQPEKPHAFPDNAHLIASNQTSLREMALAASATIISAPLIGDVQIAAEEVIRQVKERKSSKPISLAFGGETTVTLTGNGKGGRNQELALRVACVAKAAGFDFPWCFLSGGTDGRDGPTDAAGAVVDGNTVCRARVADVDINAHLQENDSYAALDASNDLLITGSTGTNVADLQLFLAD